MAFNVVHFNTDALQEQVKAKMKRHNHDQKIVAMIVKQNQSAISNFLGDRRLCSLQLAAGLCKYLRVQMGSFIIHEST